MSAPAGDVEDLLRELAPQILAAIARRYSDFADAEDAVQEALIAAAQQWPADGIPAQPRGWLLTVAARRLADMWRAGAARHRREMLTTQQEPGTPDQASDADDSLLLFLCCHPSLAASSAIPLTLRAVGGLSTAEIARAFLIPEPAMGKRISRAKQRIKDSAIPLQMPQPHEWPQRLRSVLHVLYLIFNEGYAVSAGPHVARADLTGEAIRLARMLHTWLPDEPEAAGLLALMLLTETRRPARTGPHRELVPLAEQDRTAWDQNLITEGVALISATLRKQRAGYYQLQAAIAAIHDEPKTAADTDWPQILAIYRLLARVSTNPMVRHNQAIAAAMVHGPATGLAMLDPLQAELAASHPLRRRTRPPARNGRRPRRSRHPLPHRRFPHGQRSRAKLPAAPRSHPAPTSAITLGCHLQRHRLPPMRDVGSQDRIRLCANGTAGDNGLMT